MMTNCRLYICKVPIDNIPDEPTAFAIIESCLKKSRPVRIAFVNAHAINTAAKNREYLNVLRKTDINFADGLGVWIASALIYGKGLTNLNGTDFGLSLLKWAAGKKYSVFFLGAEMGIAEKAKNLLGYQIASLNVAGCFHGYFDKRKCEKIIKDINDSGADILFVCLGVPDQELWIDQNLEHLNVKIAMGLGAFFDFHSGKIKRAPVWMRKIRMEWLFRLLSEPVRLYKRYLVGNPLFIFRVLKYKFSPHR